MKFKKTCTLLAAIVFLLLMNVVQLKAQPGLPGQPCTTSDPDAPEIDCPIDAPVMILAAVILFLSVKKITDAEHQKNVG